MATYTPPTIENSPSTVSPLTAGNLLAWLQNNANYTTAVGAEKVDKLDTYVNSGDYLEPDTAVDVTSTLQTWLTACAGKTGLLKPGTYLTSGQLVVPSNAKIIAYGALIKPSGLTGDAVHFGNAPYTLVSEKLLTANATEGATSVTVAAPDAATFAVGDTVNIRDLNLVGGQVVRQEVNVVKSVASTTVTLERPLNFSYLTADNAGIAAFPSDSGQNIHWYGGSFDMTGTPDGITGADRTAIGLWSCKHCSVNDVITYNFAYKLAQIHRSLDCHVRRCFAYAPTAVGSGRGYNTSIDMSRDCSVLGCWGINIRHCADIFGGSDCLIENCFMSGRTTGGGNQVGFFLHGGLSKRCRVSSCFADNVEQGFAAGNGTFGADYEFTAAGISTNLCDTGVVILQGCTGFMVQARTKNSVIRGATIDNSFDGRLDITVDGITTNPSNYGAVMVTGTSANIVVRPVIRNPIYKGVLINGTAGAGKTTIENPDIDMASVAQSAVDISSVVTGQIVAVRGGTIKMSSASADGVNLNGPSGAVFSVEGTHFNGTFRRAVELAGGAIDVLVRGCRMRGTITEQIRTDAGSIKIVGNDFLATGTAVRLATSTTSAHFEGNVWNAIGIRVSNTATATITGTDNLKSETPIQILNTDAIFTLTPFSSPEHTIHTGTLTANRAVTLSTTNVYTGAKFIITRNGSSDAFTLDVGTGPLKSLAKNTFGEFTYNGSAWILSAYGAL